MSLWNDRLIDTSGDAVVGKDYKGTFNNYVGKMRLVGGPKIACSFLPTFRINIFYKVFQSQLAYS